MKPGTVWLGSQCLHTRNIIRLNCPILLCCSFLVFSRTCWPCINYTHTQDKAKPELDIFCRPGNQPLSCNHGATHWDLAVHHRPTRDLSCKWPAPRKLTLLSNEGETVLCLTIFKLYWFYIVKLKATLEKKKQTRHKIKRFEKKKKGHKISTKHFRGHCGTCKCLHMAVWVQSQRNRTYETEGL